MTDNLSKAYEQKKINNKILLSIIVTSAVSAYYII